MQATAEIFKVCHSMQSRLHTGNSVANSPHIELDFPEVGRSRQSGTQTDPIMLRSNSERRFSLSSTISLSELTLTHDPHDEEPMMMSESPKRPDRRESIQCVPSATIRMIQSKGDGSPPPQLYSTRPGILISRIIDPTMSRNEKAHLIDSEKRRVLSEALEELRVRTTTV